jgi:Na+/proline symporter
MAARVFLPDLDVNNPDTMNGVYALTCLAVLPAGMLGLVIAAMFSATMSTLAGNYNAIANVLTGDFYVRLLDPSASPSRRMTVARIATVFTGLVVIGFTFLMRCVQGASDLFDVTNQVLSVFTPPIGIAMIAGVLSRRLTRRAGFAGFMLGIGCGFGAFVLGSWFPVLRESVPMFWITSISTLLGLAVFSVFMADSPSERESIDRFFRKLETPEAV